MRLALPVLWVVTLTCASNSGAAFADGASVRWISANDAVDGQARFGVQHGATILDCNDDWKAHPFKAPPSPQVFQKQPPECGNSSTPPPIHPGDNNFVLIIQGVKSSGSFATVTDRSVINALSHVTNDEALSKASSVLIWDAKNGKSMSAKDFTALRSAQKLPAIILQSQSATTSKS
jgi:hypothetical protein